MFKKKKTDKASKENLHEKKISPVLNDNICSMRMLEQYLENKKPNS